MKDDNFIVAVMKEAKSLLASYAPHKVETRQGEEEIRAFVSGARFARKLLNEEALRPTCRLCGKREDLRAGVCYGCATEAERLASVRFSDITVHVFIEKDRRI